MLVYALPVGPLEIPGFDLERIDSSNVIEAVLTSPSAGAVTLTHVPRIVHADRPLDIRFTAPDLHMSARAAATVARCISAHARITVVVLVEKGWHRGFPVSVSVRYADSSWIARVLIRPASWAGALSVSVVSVALVRWPVPSTCLPATMPVGFNHAPVPAGPVSTAAKAGDMQVRLDILEAGESTGD